MGRPKAEQIWSYVERGPSKSAKCKFCNKNYKFVNITRMKSHLMNCAKCPSHVRMDLKRKSGYVSPERITTNQLQIGEASSSSIISSVHEERIEIENLSDCDDTTYLLFNTVSSNQKRLLDRKLAKAIYVSGSPLSLVEHSLWKEFFNELQPSYKLPSKKDLSTTLLDEVFSETENEFIVKLSSASDLHLQLDGLSNIRDEGVINCLISTPETAFVKYLNNRHASDYITIEIIEVLKKYGEDKFFVIIGDTSKNMQSALENVKIKYPHIVPLGCAAHALKLLCHDYLKCASLSNVVDTVTQIIKASKSSKILAALCEKITRENKSGPQLKLSCKTRWGVNTASLETFYKFKAELRALAVNKKCNLSRDAMDALLNEDFWTKVSGTLSLLKPISKWMLELESKEYNVSKVLSMFAEIDESIESASDLILTDAEKRQLIENISQSKVYCVKPIHLAAHMLDPKTQGQLLSAEEEIEAMSFIEEVASSLKMDNIMSELADYKAKEGQLWRQNFVWSCVSQVNPVSWWKGICSTSTLSKIAVRILSAPTTSAATEQSFSKIYTKFRKQLPLDRVGKLTYIFYNCKLTDNKQNPMTDVAIDLDSDDDNVDDESGEDEKRSSSSFQPVPSSSTANLNDFYTTSDSE